MEQTVNWFLKNSYWVIREAAISYFAPILYINSRSKSANSIAKHKEEIKSISKSNDRTLAIIQSSICFNQGAFIQYSFLTAEKHKKMKEEFFREARNKELVSAYTKDLIDYLNKSFYENTYKNFEYLHSYFEGRRKIAPRICIKGNFSMLGKDTIVSVFRDRPVYYDSDAELINNTGFATVAATGRYYIQNNIPLAAKARKYINPRLDSKKVKELSRAYFPGINKNNKSLSESWAECWRDYSREKNDEASYYKSTMIVPMTLWNNDLVDEFKDLIKIRNVDRAIFGFLCFDHVEENYFSENKDVSIGYIFADILSLYVMTRLIYTEISKTYDEVEAYLKKEDIAVKIESYESALKNMPQFIKAIEIASFKPKKTKVNRLFSIDDVLVNFAHRTHAPDE